MAKFNSIKNIKTYEGALAKKKDLLSDWFNFICSSKLEDTFYESADSQILRYYNLTKLIAEKYGWEFIAKAAVFTRKGLGMRSISNLTAAILNEQKFENKRTFFHNIMKRPDDVAETFAAIDTIGGKRSHALVRGAGDYLSELNEYAVSKYKLNGHKYNMYDLINITHASSPVINSYKNGTLTPPETWEVLISTSESDEEKYTRWIQLLTEKKLGYLALIRNLNNLTEAINYFGNSYAASCLHNQLTDEEAIKKSMVFPYQIYTAYRNCKYSSYWKNDLEYAFMISTENMPQVQGRSCIMIDVSGSMFNSFGNKSKVSMAEASACYAYALWQKNPNMTIIKFGTIAKIVDLTHKDYTPFEFIEMLTKNDNCGHGTYLQNAFEIIDGMRYDNIFIFSDMQTMEYSTFYGVSSFQEWKKSHPLNVNSHCFSFDLSNYPSQPEGYADIHMVSGLSEKIFALIPFYRNSQELEKVINKMSYV